jgi:chromosome segregation ATPase
VETKQQLEAARANSDVVLQDADKFQEEKDKLASNLEDLTAERNHLAEKNMKVQLLLADKDASLATLQETTRSRDSLQDEVEQLKQQNDEGLSQIQILTGERDNWKTKAKKSQQLANEAETSVQALQEQMEQMRNAERYSVDGEMKSVQIQIDGLLTERTELKTALAREQNSVATAETEISSLRGSLAGMASLQIEIDRLATSNADLSSQLASLAAQRDELQSSVAVSESRSIEAKSAMSSLEAERDKDAETLRQQNTQVMAQSAALQSEQAKLNALASRFEQVESALEESKHALTESEKRFADLESQHQAVETKVGDLLAERNELQAAVEKATLDLIAAETLASSSSDVEKECAVLLKNFTALGEDVEEAQKQRLAAEERLQDLSTERDRLLESIAIAEAKSEAAEQELASVDVSGLQKESAKFRDRLKLSPEDDAVGTLEQLQQDYSDLLDDNYRLRENLGDYEAEIDELVGERDEWMAQAQKKTPVTSPETSRSTAETQGMDGMQELCEELQRQLQSITRDRDIWKETAESATRTGNKGERRGRSRSVARDDSSVMSDMSDQKMLLQQAIEYRDRRDGKKSSSMFSFGGRRASKFESDPGANEPDREELIDQLTEAQEQNERTISQLKTEVFELNKSLKEDVYSNKKKTEAIEQENSAYELKVMVLEQELERLSSEVGASQGPEDTERIRSLQRDLTNFQNEKKDVEQEIASLQTHFDKLHRASTQEVVHKQTKIDHLKTLQDDFQAKIDALENMMLAIDKENETLREIAQKAGNFSIDSDLGRVLAENDKDVKIAQLHNQLVELRMQGHQQLTDKVLQLQDEKLQMQAVMEEHFQIVAEENESILEDLEMRLSAREQTIKQLESMLDQRNGVGGASLSGTSHSGESR